LKTFVSYRKIFRIFLVSLLLICILPLDLLNAQSILKKRIDLLVKGKSLEEVILILQNNHGIAFSYSKTLIRLDKKVSADYSGMALDEILDDLFRHANIIYILKAGMIVLQPKPQNIDKVILTGTVRNIENGKPIEFAGIRLKNTGKGAITDVNGNFSFQVKKSELSDSLEISCIGFEKQNFVASGFTEGSQHVVYLRLQEQKINTVNISAKDFRIKSAGNHAFLSFGSIYIDTHGQQTAMFIKNPEKRKGIISSVSFYLSKKGNLQSPYRIRIYEKDSITKKPGRDLLTDMLVVKPDGPGWFITNISVFNIDVPEGGFFVAIEGIYPNEYNYGGNQDNENENYPNSISYGQRLGYSKKKGDNTWHFSLAQTWFQLKEDNFHVMISAEIQYRKKNKKL
jgi:hypothetical protein